MDIYPDFHVPHADEQRPDAETITWQEPMSRFQCVRVIRHTCEWRARLDLRLGERAVDLFTGPD